MKHFAKALAICALGLSLAGCFQIFNPDARSVLTGGPSLVAKVDIAPVSRTSLAAVESAYNVLTAGLNAYYRRPLCEPGVMASWTNLCSEAAARRELAQYRRTARASIMKARKFQRENPRVSAITLIRAAGDAVADLRAVATINGVKTQ